MEPRLASPYLESLLHASRDGILVTDADGNVEFANPASCRFLDVPLPQLLGTPLRNVIPEESLGAFVRLWNLLVAGRPSQLTLERTDGRGVSRTLLVNCAPLESSDSKKFFFDVRDMTERVRIERELREERDRARRYLQIAGVLIVAIDPEQNVVLANRRACEILGYPEERILGRNWFDHFVPPSDRDRVKEAFDALMRGALDMAESFENSVLTHDGSERLIAWHNKLVYDDSGKIIGTISSGTDITERKKAERELRELTETLEQRVVERTAVAEEQSKRLRALARELIQVELRERRRIALLLHEHFQQLLAAARMNLSRTRQRVENPDLRETLDGTDAILLEAVESSRTLAIELCPPVLYELGLVPALQWLGKRMYEQHELEVRVDADLHEEMQDPDLRSFCFEAVRELLFNVVKHSGVRRARVDLQRSGHFLRIDVSDAGVGFDAQELCPSNTESLEFGLLTIRERFSSLGGRVEVESAPGAGTRVCLFAPWSSGRDRSPGPAG